MKRFTRLSPMRLYRNSAGTPIRAVIWGTDPLRYNNSVPVLDLNLTSSALDEEELSHLLPLLERQAHSCLAT